MTQEYVGTKIVTAWKQDQEDTEGYAIKYEHGYVSWSPKEPFEKANIPLGNIAHLPEFHQRLIAERAVMQSNFEKLTAALPGFSDKIKALTEQNHESLPYESKHYELLVKQHHLMYNLLNVFTSRLDLLAEKPSV